MTLAKFSKQDCRFGATSFWNRKAKTEGLVKHESPVCREACAQQAARHSLADRTPSQGEEEHRA
jgi:hypothetical protein